MKTLSSSCCETSRRESCCPRRTFACWLLTHLCGTLQLRIHIAHFSARFMCALTFRPVSLDARVGALSVAHVLAFFHWFVVFAMSGERGNSATQAAQLVQAFMLHDQLTHCCLAQHILSGMGMTAQL